MTGIAELYLCLRRPHSKDARARLKAVFQSKQSHYDHTRFVVLSWKRSGSNLLCGILHHHPEITMHNELFNPIDIFTYYPKSLLRNQEQDRWTVLGRDLWPEAFLDHIWTGSYWDGTSIKENAKAVGFKSFPDHWTEVQNEPVWQEHILEDFRIKKVVLIREDELAVYVSMKRAEISGNYMTLSYPKSLKLHIDPAHFQSFINNYRDTFRRKYKSPMERRDTFRISYEQMLDLVQFEKEVLPLLWKFLGVDPSQPLKKLRETTKQADPDELLSEVIENYEELEFCFRHTDVLHFSEKNKQGMTTQATPSQVMTTAKLDVSEEDCLMSWSLLLPICSRTKATTNAGQTAVEATKKFNSNRLIDLVAQSQYSADAEIDQKLCWKLLRSFAKSLSETASVEQLLKTECVVGIDVDDPVFSNQNARQKIRQILPCTVLFVDIQPENYGRVCKIWNQLARHARNDFVVLLGDDIVLLDNGWQQRVVHKFHSISQSTGLPFGAACVALRDMTFPGFPTFPVMHRWHIKKFGTLIPKQFINQGADLFELYSRFRAAAFEVTCRLENTIGGDNDARYKKHEINWRGQILRLSIQHLREFVGGTTSTGICIDIVVPSYRINNSKLLHRIASLRATTDAYVRFWIVVDNPLPKHVLDVQELANKLNDEQLEKDGNYFVNVLSYGENRGASHARNIGYNYSTADWVLFLDDDVVPDDHILDAYIGAMSRYPDAKVLVGLTELPECCNRWTEMLRTCNIMFFYGVAQSMTHPPWGVTANLMVRGSRHNPTIQFKNLYPKTGGGEDVDFVLQFKQWYQSSNSFAGSTSKTVVGVPGAKAQHPWWCNGNPCFGQINGWAWGDSLCIREWPQKTFLVLPNWIECLVFGVVPFTCFSGRYALGLKMIFAIAGLEHFFRTVRYFRSARTVVGPHASFLRIAWVAFGAGTVPSAQEIVRVWAVARRLSLFSLCRRFDWNDGQQPKFKLDVQFGSFLRFAAFAVVSLLLIKGEEVPLFPKKYS